MTPQRGAIGTIPIALAVAAIVVVAAVSIIAMGQPGSGTTAVTTSSPSTSSGTTATSTASESCYGGTIPTNGSSSGAQNYNRTVFNITEEFDSWDWTSLSTFNVGSYTFVTTNPASAPSTAGTTTFVLEPQLFFNVTNSQGQTQRTSVTNLGSMNGQTWPPEISLQQMLFGGNVSIQWLFQCNSQNVFLEVTTTSSQGTSTVTGPSVVSLPQPQYITCNTSPGISEVIVNGATKCVVGPPIVVNDDGVVDFRNGTGVDLYANLTGSSFIGGGTSYDAVVTLQATRFIFSAHGLIATIYPYQGREVFANGTITTFPACTHPISTSTQYPRGTSGNGTVNFPAADGGTVWFYPDGTCSETNG